MKLFGYRLVKEEDYQEFRRWGSQNIRLQVAHRWLAEFDRFLDPLWDYVFDGSPDIGSAREKMRDHPADVAMRRIGKP